MRQKQALKIMMDGRSVFLTGPPGAGKTFVLNQFIGRARRSGKTVAVTASTGIAATHIGGVTIHSWSGLGVRDVLDSRDQALIASRKAKSLASADVLVIDEVSMLHGKRLDMVDKLLRHAREDQQPFGGVQMVLVGDLFQLPPVSRGSEDDDFAHQSQAWSNLEPQILYLSEQHRQKDGELLDLLVSMRNQDFRQRHIDLLNQRLEATADSDDITKLYTHNADVDRINQKHLDALPGDEHIFEMQSKGAKKYREVLAKSVLAPEILVLKEGAKVMFVANDPSKKFANGTQGTVVGFDKESGLPKVKLDRNGRSLQVDKYTWQQLDGEKSRAEVAQLPLRLAWAITIHKSQGMSLDTAEIDLSKAFAPGMGYVALSRLRHIDGLYLRGINKRALLLHPTITEIDQGMQSSSSTLAQQTSDIADEVIVVETVPDVDSDLLEKLRAWRTERARKNSVPAYVVAHDSLLEELARHRPTTKSKLLNISGMGPKRLETYGDELLKILG